MMDDKEKALIRSEVGKKRAAQREVVEHTCEWCGKKFHALKIAVFCSNRCRQANKYAQVKAKREGVTFKK